MYRTYQSDEPEVDSYDYCEPAFGRGTSLEADVEPRMELHAGLEDFYTQAAELEEYMDDEVLLPTDKTCIQIGNWNISEICQFLRDPKMVCAFHPIVIEHEEALWLVF